MMHPIYIRKSGIGWIDELDCSQFQRVGRTMHTSVRHAEYTGWQIFAIAAILMLFVTAVPRLFGQATEFGTLSGTVTDSAGSVIANAKVTATDIAKGESYPAMTNSSGQYRIPNLLPAQYTLTIEASGFKTVTIAAFKLDVGQTLTQNRTLPAGATSERIEVHAQGELLQTTTVSSSTTIEAAQINDLPLNGRNYSSLIDLTPGADGTRINGQFTDANRYVLDGANNTTVLYGQSAYVPNLDLIQEFSIDSHTTQTEIGGFLGATVSVASKSGTNQFRGDAFEFGRNNEFVARDPISDPPGVAFPPYHFNQYGIVVGGPVYIPKVYDGRNKTFFFFGFQGTKTTQQSYEYTRVPTADELAGNFQNSLFFLATPGIQHLYNPYTTTTGDNPTRQPFTGDVIPTPLISTLMQSYFKLMIPPPNFTPDANHPTVNRLDLFPNLSQINDYSIRIDQRLGTHDNLWGRYSQVSNVSTGFQGTYVSQPETLNRNNLVADWVHTFTPKLFVESNYSYQLFPEKVNDTLPANTIQSLTGSGFNAAALAAYGPPDFNGTGVQSPYITTGFELNEYSPFSLNEQLSWNIGRHAVKVGVSVSHKHLEVRSIGNHYFASSTQTEDPQNSGVTGLAFASMLLGLPNNVNIGSPDYAEAYLNGDVYAEDQWKVSSNLTISAGVRYDNFPTPHFIKSTINDWDFNNGIWYIGGGKLPPPCITSGVSPCVPGDGNLADLPYGNMIQVSPYSGIRHPIHDNFGPRIGVAWNVLPNTVVRAGFGIYFDTEGNIAQEDQNTNYVWPLAGTQDASFNQIGGQSTTFSQIQGQAISPLPPLTPWGTVTYFWDPAKKDQESQQWNVDVQQQFSKNSVFTLAYLGSRTLRGDMTIDVNAAQTPGSGDAAVVNARRKWPFYGTDTFFGTDLGRGNYNGLQVKFEQRMTNGLQMLLAYTLSKTMDNGENTYYYGSPQDSYDVNADYGVSDADRRNIFSSEAIYELPFGKNKEWLNQGIASYIAGGWQLNAIGRMQSGNPVVLQATGDPANIGNSLTTYARPDLVGNPHVAHPSGEQWFNQAAFSQPVYSYGDAGRGLIYNPWYENLDASIFKNTPIHKDMYLQLRLEAFNALNLIMRGGVDGTYTNNPTFGQIHSIGSTPRQLQFGAKLYF
jgi:hypothetical protein